MSRRAIIRLLEAARDSSVVLDGGVDRKNAPRTAHVEEILGGGVVLSTVNLKFEPGRQLFFNFILDGRKYFFAATASEYRADSRIAISLPNAIFEAERRDNGRLSAGINPAVPTRIEISPGSSQPVEAKVIDCSYEGLGVALPTTSGYSLPNRFPIRFLDGDRAGQTAYAHLRHDSALPSPGWRKVGLAISGVSVESLLPVEKRVRIFGNEPLTSRFRRGADTARSLVLDTLPGRLRVNSRARHRSQEIRTVRFENEFGQEITAIVDSTGVPTGAPTIVIPPAWGRTKETLLPLSEVLLASFRRAGESVTVVRFDGTNRRGESHIDPECQGAGDEYLHFRFSRAVSDIEATVEFFSASPEFRASAIVLVTFSLAAVEGRRAVARNRNGKIVGWIAVVGMVDLQSGLRAVSGGVDYAFGLRHGVEFGVHELVGVRADMDHTGSDALDNNLVFLEDARRDMANISVPVTWLHGRHDAWMDLNRVQDVMSAGDQSRRRLIEVPTGHQLRTSREALQTFQVVSQEAGRMLLGKTILPGTPSPSRVARRAEAERARLNQRHLDVRQFWSDYLLGRDRRVGIELMTATSAYSELMERQIELLSVQNAETIVDLGSGTGGFRAAIAERYPGRNLRTIEIDFVQKALLRSRSRWEALESSGMRGSHIAADLNVGSDHHIPVADAVADGVLASLFISYIDNPSLLIREAARVLRSGGRLVLSSLRRDADISRIYVHGVREVFAGDLEQRLGVKREAFSDLQRQFLNDAGRILDLEERGVFRFRDESELVALVRGAGFSRVHVERSFGEPPQAIVVSGVRR